MNPLRFTVTDTTNPITIGLPISELANVIDVSVLRIRTVLGLVVPSTMIVQSRWRGLASDTSKAIKNVLVSFQPTATGEHHLIDTNESQTLPSAFTVTNGASDIRVQNGAALDVRIPKTGRDLISQFVQNGAEQLAAGSKPRLTTPLVTTPNSVKVVKHPTLSPADGPQAAAAGQRKIQLASQIFAVNDQVRFAWSSKYLSHTTTDINLTGDHYGTWYREEPNGGNQPGTNPHRNIIFARGTGREFLLTGDDPDAFTYFYQDTNQIHNDNPYQSAQLTALGNLLVNDTVEDAQLAGNDTNGLFTISSISGNEITVDRDLPVEILVHCNASIEGAPPPTPTPTDSLITGATVVRQNAYEVILKQSGIISADGSTTAIPDFSFDIYYYFYANKNYVRARLRLKNLTTDFNHQVQDIFFEELKMSFPTAFSTTASDVSITTLSAATTRIVNDGMYAITREIASANNFKVGIAEFAEMFPQRLQASGNLINWYIFPALGGGNTTRFWHGFTQHWDFYLGGVSAAQFNLTSVMPVTPHSADWCATKVFSNALAPMQTWQASQFGGSAELAEAANRAERYFGCAYRLSDCDSQEALGSTPRGTIFEHRLGSQLFPGSTHNMGQMFGWDQYRNLRSDQDGLTYNRYDIDGALLREWVRGGDPNAYFLGASHARFMTDSGTVQSAETQNGIPEMDFRGTSRYERSTDPVTGLQNPRPSHSWSRGKYYYWLITGDPIARETLDKVANRARTYNFVGTNVGDSVHNGWLLSGAGTAGEARHAGWAALELMNAYNYDGVQNDLTLVKQYLDHLRLNEEAQGSKGWFFAAGQANNGPSLILGAYIWMGYPAVALFEYCREKRIQGAPDTALEAFIVRIADWLIKGDATAGSPQANRPLVGATGGGASYQPYAVRDFDQTATYSYASAYVVTVDICIVAIIAAARFTGRTDLRTIADQMFRDVCFWREAAQGASVDFSTRTPINFMNGTYRSSTAKVAGQTDQALIEYLSDVSTTLPTISTLSPANVTAGAPQTSIAVFGENFQNGAIVRVNGSNRTTIFVGATQVTGVLPAADFTTAGTLQITVINPDNNVSNSASLVVNNPVPSLSTIAPTTAVAGDPQFTLTVNGGNFNAQSVVRWNGSNRATTFIGPSQLTATITAGDIASAGTATVTVFNPTPGGGTSSGATFTITTGGTPAPSLSTLSPSSATAGGAQFTLTVNGANFVNGAIVRWNGSNRSTTFVSSTQLNATIPATDITAAGTATITVINPDSQTSNSLTFTINAPAPAISSISPSSTTAGGAQFTLTVNGANFVNGAVVRWNGSNRTTTFGSSTQLTATITAGDIAAAGTAQVSVRNPDNQTSGNQTFTINSASAPSLSTLSPSSTTAGGAQFTLTVNGANFVSGAVVRWNGSNRTTTFGSATQLTATIPATDITSAGSATITVQNPDTQISNGLTFTINAASNPVPVLNSISPTTTAAGGPQFTLTLTGSNFVASSQARWNNQPLSTTFVSPTQLTAIVPASYIQISGSASVTVFNPTPGGGTSASRTFNITAGQSMPPPFISTLSPSSVIINSGAFTLIVNGGDIQPGVAGKIQNVQRPTSYVSATRADISVQNSDIQTLGPHDIVLVNPDGQSSNVAQLTVANPTGPTIYSLSPSSAPEGTQGNLALTLTGINFASGAVVKVDGSARTTSYVNGTQLIAQLTTGDMSVPGVKNITVTNPNNDVSPALGFTVIAVNRFAPNASIKPTRQDYRMQTGDAFRVRRVFRRGAEILDLTGCKAEFEIRRSRYESTQIIPLLLLTSDAGDIVIEQTAGAFIVQATELVVNQQLWRQGWFRWRVVTAANERVTLIHGLIERD